MESKKEGDGSFDRTLYFHGLSAFITIILIFGSAVAFGLFARGTLFKHRMLFVTGFCTTICLIGAGYLLVSKIYSLRVRLFVCIFAVVAAAYTAHLYIHEYVAEFGSIRFSDMARVIASPVLFLIALLWMRVSALRRS